MSGNAIFKYTNLALLFAALVFTGGCGGNDEEPAPQPAPTETAAAPAPDAATAVPPAEETATAAPAVPPPPVAIPLSWTPEEAQVAVGIPAFNTTLDKTLKLARRLVPDPAMVDNIQQQMLTHFATLIGLEQADSFGSAAAAKGIDLDSPAALFVDFATAMKTALESSQTAAAKGIPPSMNMGDMMEDPSLLLAFSVTDAELAESSARELLSNAHGELEVEVQEALAGEVEQVLYPALGTGFFIHEGYLCMGDINLLASAAAKTAAPLSLRYGSAVFQAGAPDEIVSLFFANRLVPFYKELAESMPADTPEQVKLQLETQAQIMERMFGSGESEDPIIGTLNLDDERLVLASNAYAEAHPGMVETAGEPAALKFLKLQPENSLAVIAAGLNDSSKQMLREQLQPLFAGGGAPDAAAGSDPAALFESVIAALGDEVTLSAGPGAAMFPAALAMVDLADTEAAKVLLGGMTQPTGQKHRDVDIGMFPVMFPILTAITNDTLVVATDQAALTQTLDLLMDGGTTDYVANLQPALDPAQPRYSLFLLDPAAALRALAPMMNGMDGGGLPPAMQGPLGVIRQVRGTSGIDGPWITSELTVYLNP